MLPGDLNHDQLIDQIIRVNHAGEYGAKRIYQGQMSVLKSPKDQELLKTMHDQEQVHLDYFSQEIPKRNVRPSMILPLWNILGYALGAGTAILGKNAAMVCTEAVEEVIDQHYKEQIDQLNNKNEPELQDKISQFRIEEIEHHDLAQEHMTKLNLGHKLLYHTIKKGCKIAIELSKRF